MPNIMEKVLSRPQRNTDIMNSFGIRLHNQFSNNEAYRRTKEIEWLENLRQMKGLYDPDVKIETNNSKVYPKITRSKVNIVLSRLHEMLFPETDKNWEIKPTPEPRVSTETVRQIVQSLVVPSQQDLQTGQMIPAKLPAPSDVKIAIIKFTSDACEKMSIQIDDQLTEMDYSEETKQVLRSGLMYGTGIMKGPLISKRTKRRWEPDSITGEFAEKTELEEVPYLEFVRVWDWYPDMSVTDVDKMTGSFHRHIMSKHDLRQLMKREDFYGDIIEEYIRDHSFGNYNAKNWEVDLQVIEIEAGSGKGTRTLPSSTTDGSNVFADDESSSTSRPSGKKYEVLEFWGYIDGTDLEACGVDIDDVSIEYGANVWLLGSKVIKVILFDTPLDQYKVFYYEKDETSIFGEGLARIMRHSQISISAAARMTLDNAACVAGPQVEINWSLMTPDTDINSFYARKLWFREGRGVDAQYPALRSIEFNSHIPELISIIELFKQFGDEETTLPTWMIGQMLNNETAQATSARMSTITVSIKDVVKNFDSFTEKIIRDLYAWNMEFNPRQDIKGDYLCKARGVSSLVMKEIRLQALNQLATTMSPEDWDYVDRRDFLKERFKVHDVVIPIKTEEEVQKLREERSQGIAMQLAIEMQKSEIAKNKAQSMSLLSKAKERNVEAIKEAQTPPELSESSDPRLTEGELALQKTEQAAKLAGIRRLEEAHSLDMSHTDEAHRTKMVTETAKTVHDMKLKEKMATMKAKQVKALPISKKATKRE